MSAGSEGPGTAAGVHHSPRPPGPGLRSRLGPSRQTQGDAVKTAKRHWLLSEQLKSLRRSSLLHSAFDKMGLGPVSSGHPKWQCPPQYETAAGGEGSRPASGAGKGRRQRVWGRTGPCVHGGSDPGSQRGPLPTPQGCTQGRHTLSFRYPRGPPPEFHVLPTHP